MIDFRCWYCNNRYWVADDSRGERSACSCGRRVKVPRRSGGRSRVWTVTDFLVEALVYGGGGAILGCGLGALVATRLPFRGRVGVYILGGCMLLGLLVGAVGGEPAINRIGRMIREREQERL